MAACDPQLTQAQREAAYQQQRTGVVRAVRPFSGSATVENLIDYINRELGPAVRSAREAVNDVYLQVADNAPSANPLAFYFATSTVNADPTVGRIRLNQATQNTSTVLRVSQNNARRVDVQPWLDVMAGGPTAPLGVVTLTDAINPGRFIRWDLNTMTDQGAYWDLGVTVIESSDPNPFVEDEAVTVGFIAGVSAAGSTVPVGALSPIGADTFVGNITTGTAPPAAVPLADIDSTGIVYDPTSHTFQRAALTGAIAASQNSNATLFAGIRDNGATENGRTNLNHLSTTSIVAVVTDDAGNDELEITHERAALTGFATASQNSNATTSAEPIVTYSASANMSAERVTTSSISVAVSTSVASQIEFQRAALTGAIAAPANSNLTLFSGILDNNSAETDRINLDFRSTASVISSITDNGVFNKLEIESERAALTGAIAASQNSNATLFSGIRDNGSAETDRTNLNFVSSTSATALVTDDAGNDELEVTYQRAALTGDVTAAADSNATTIANDAVTNAKAANMASPRLKGRTTASTGDPEDLTLVNSTTNTWNTATGGSISLERAALTGEVTASANANATTIVRSTNFQSAPWTGDHQFNGAVVGLGVFSFTTLGATTSNLAIGAVNCVRIDPSGISDVLTGMVPSHDGQWVWLENVDSTVGFTINHDATSTAANRFYCPVSQNFFLPARVGLWCRYDGTLQRWILSDTKQSGGITVIDVAGAASTSGVSTLAFNAGLNTAWVVAGSLAAPFIRTDLTLNVSANPTFDSVLINEQATSPAVPAGDGMFWVRSDTPNVAMFTDDAGTDFELSPAGRASITATSSTITAATTDIAGASYSVFGGSMVVGTTFRLTMSFRFVHTAAATPTLTFEGVWAGTARVSGVMTPVSTSGTYDGLVECYFVVRSIGATGTVIGRVSFSGGSGVLSVATDTAPFGTINTTATATLACQLRMTTGVASNTLTVYTSTIERVFR